MELIIAITVETCSTADYNIRTVHAAEVFMAYSISDRCTGCGSCRTECPVGAISKTENGKSRIDPALCVECGNCASVCAWGAVDE